MSYDTEVAADSPVGLWWLDEASGTNVADSSGNGNDGTYHNTPTLGISGPIDGHTAVRFDNASSQYVNIPSATELFVASSWSAEAWFLGASAGSPADFGAPTLFTVAYDGARVPFMLGFWDGTNIGTKPSAGYFNGSHVTSQSATGIADDTWHHLVATWDGTDLKIYVDAVLKHTTTPGGSDAAAVTDLLIARRWDTTSNVYLKGSVAAVALYNTALSLTRITAHYVAGVSVPQAVDVSSTLTPTVTAHKNSGQAVAATTTLTAGLATKKNVGQAIAATTTLTVGLVRARSVGKVIAVTTSLTASLTKAFAKLVGINATTTVSPAVTAEFSGPTHADIANVLPSLRQRVRVTGTATRPQAGLGWTITLEDV